jgi:hypothetical protein
VIFERIIREALTPDPLEVAKARVRTRAVGQIIRERRALVHSALARSIPTAPASDGCSGSAS